VTGPADPNKAAQETQESSAHPDLMRFLFQSVEDPQQLRGYRIAILVSDGVDGFDLAIPQRFLIERGASVQVIAPRPKVTRTAGSGPVVEPSTQIAVLNPSGEQDVATVDRFLDQVQARDFDAVYLPGNRALSREFDDSLSTRFLQQAVHAGKPIFATGNAALVLLAAGLLEQRRATGDATTLERLAASNAYATDAALVIDGPIYTSRDAFDMPALMERLVGRLLAQPVRGE
jgi:protease I